MATETRAQGRVLLLGEALVDLTERQCERDRAFIPHPGGSPLNVAVGLARLGVPSALCAIVADDGLGIWLQRFLADEGIDTSWLMRTGARTTISLATLHDGEPSYAFYPDEPTLRDLDWSPRISAEQPLAIHAGSIGLLDRRVAAAALDAFSRTELLRTFDPNVRPSLIADPADYREYVEQLAARSDLVKLSREDAEYLYPGLDDDGVAEHVRRLGARAVVLTRAADGVSAWSEHGRADAPTSGLPVHDTTGGGDATMAALIADLVRSGMPTSTTGWESNLRRAMRIAGLACSRAGGAESMPRRYELDPDEGPSRSRVALQARSAPVHPAAAR